MRLINQKGFSLIQVMIAIGLSGGVALAIMRMVSTMEQAQTSSQSKMDELDLRTEIRMILNNDKHCRVSLAGDGPVGAPTSPVRFYKTNIDENNEGLDVELFVSNVAGDARSVKKLSATDTTANSIGRIKINSIKLLMNNGTGSNYPASTNHNDIGELRIVAEKSIAAGKKRDIF